MSAADRRPRMLDDLTPEHLLALGAAGNAAHAAAIRYGEEVAQRARQHAIATTLAGLLPPGEPGELAGFAHGVVATLADHVPPYNDATGDDAACGEYLTNTQRVIDVAEALTSCVRRPS